MRNVERENSDFTRVEAASHAEASARIEGVTLDAEAKSILRRWAEGECSSEELDDWIQKQTQAVTRQSEP